MKAEYDLFLSYRWADKATVAPLVTALESLGITVWQDARGENPREVEDLASIQQAVTQGIARSRALLAWYSVRYNESRACQWELTSAYLAGQAEGDPHRRVLVVNAEPGSVLHIHLPELFDQLHLNGRGVPDDGAAVAALAQRLHAKLGSDVPPEPMGHARSVTPPPWLPHSGTGSSRFVGRLREMWLLHGALHAGQAAMLTGSGGKPSLAQVRGAGGIGKSLLAEEYALRFGAAYPGGVFWLRAYGYTDSAREIGSTERDSLREGQLLDFASRLGLPVQGLTAPEVQGQLARHLGQAGLPYLWVVDDLPPDPGDDGLGPWLAPHPLGCTLVTTRARRFDAVKAIEMPQLGADDSLRLLARGQQPSAADEPVAREICAVLGHHALAVDVAAALVQRRGYAAFLKSLRRDDRDALELAATGFSDALPNGHERSIAATLLASIRELDEPARDLLRVTAMVAAAPIPRDLLLRTLAYTDQLDDDDAADRCDPATEGLRQSSLADDAGFQTIVVHALVSRTVRFRDAQAERATALRRGLVAALSEQMQGAGDIRNHADLADWVSHAREVSRAPQAEDDAGLRCWVGAHEWARGQYREAAASFQVAFETLARVLGEEHPDTLAAMGNLANMLSSQGELPGARALQERVLETTQRVLGEEHPDALSSMNNLAYMISSQGDLPGARALQERVLETRQRVLGEEHPGTLSSMNNLADTLSSQGDLPGARALQERVLETRKRVLGEEHPGTLISMNNLADTLSSQGDLPGARALQERVLETIQRVLGEDHPDTLAAMGNLANTLLDQGDLPGARALQERVLEATWQVLGKEHLDTLTAMGNLANTLLDQGDLPDARALQERVLETMQEVLGDEHPDTLAAMGNLANSLWSQGDLPGARALQERVLETRQRVLGEEHPGTLTSMGNLANTLWSQGDLPGARALQERVLETTQRVLGEEHPDALRSMNNLASTLSSQGDLPGALALQERVLEMRQRMLGEEHPRTLTSMNNLADTLSSQGDLPGARVLQERVLEATWRVLGEEHPDTLTAMSNLANTVSSQGDLPGARTLQERVLETTQRVLGEEHPGTLTSMNNLADTLSSQGDLPGARALQERVLEATWRVLGEEHPDTLTAMNNLANTLSSQGDLPGARTLQERVLETTQRVLGEEHPDTLTSMGHLASTLSIQGDLLGARALQERVLEKMQRMLGEEHPYTLTSMGNLALTIWKQGDPSAALDLQSQAVDGLRRMLGDSHPSSINALRWLAHMREEGSRAES